MRTKWLAWNELSEEQKKQARESYLLMCEKEERLVRDTQIDTDGVMECRFEILPDGYVYVDV